MCKIITIGTSLPSFILKQDTADSLLTEHYGDILSKRGMDVMHQILSHPGITKRHVAVNNIEELLSIKNENMDFRIQRFSSWAVKLSKEAIEKALVKANKPASDIKGLVVNTCTGYICPGISTYLIEALRLPSSVRVYDLVGSGCGGAIPNIEIGKAVLNDLGDDQGIVVCVSVEICSATFEMGNDMSLIVSNSIFGDGAAAVVLSNHGYGLKLETIDAFYNTEYRNDVRYVHKNGRLHNQLSPKLPEIISEKVPPLIIKSLKRKKLKPSNINFWAIHPGGDKILSNIQKVLELSGSKMKYAREVLSQYGNMSSPSVLFELEKIFSDSPEENDWCSITSFGAGLSAYTCLARFL
ncbi:MAG: 3-oxoacyl-[acyl-carrier-protein] synthase III C-terminal domain-containing protein [Chitinispirillia bacterium]|jgi:predicted naringenin-chalcone synthase